MVIDGVMEDSALRLERDGLQLDATFNRQPRITPGPVLEPFYYRDADWFEFGSTTSVAVYDPHPPSRRDPVWGDAARAVRTSAACRRRRHW